MDGEHFRISRMDQLKHLNDLIEESLTQSGELIITIFDARRRSGQQNMLQHAMYREIGKQLYGGDMEHAKAECKLTIGVPLLRASSEKFKELYDKNFKAGLSFERKLELMAIVDISSLLSISQANEYIGHIYDRYAEKFSWSDFISRSQKALAEKEKEKRG